jgi:hypothetical protein|eukprot:COSAG01_NODE_2628_length_7351_cov_3.274645_10_plen_69_part_00
MLTSAIYGEENLVPDVFVMYEDAFGARFVMELLALEVVAKDNHFGKQRDEFALFRVLEISSWEHFSGS